MTRSRLPDLMPGADQTRSINYSTDVSSSTEDVWLYFPAGIPYDAFTGAKGSSYPDGGLGRFGHFKVVSDQNMGFESYNLQVARPSRIRQRHSALHRICGYARRDPAYRARSAQHRRHDSPAC